MEAPSASGPNFPLPVPSVWQIVWGLPRGAPLNTCPVKFRKNERCGFIGVAWKWSSVYLTGVALVDGMRVKNWLIFSLLDLLNYPIPKENRKIIHYSSFDPES